MVTKMEYKSIIALITCNRNLMGIFFKLICKCYGCLFFNVLLKWGTRQHLYAKSYTAFSAAYTTHVLFTVHMSGKRYTCSLGEAVLLALIPAVAVVVIAVVVDVAGRMAGRVRADVRESRFWYWFWRYIQYLKEKRGIIL
jgi:hypothetical protein